MNRLPLKHQILICLSLVLFLPRSGFSAPPNILLIISDDQGYGDASCFWDKTELKTPVMDEIAANGIQLTHFRVNPLCAPTRSSVMTGIDSIYNGMWRGPSNPGQERRNDRTRKTRAIHANLRMLPEYLKEAGYATGIFGKWHLGYEAPNLPNDRGFDEFIGFLGGAHPYWLGRNSRILKNREPLASDKHTTDLFADSAIEFIREHQNQPFFCYVPFNAVHGPLRSEGRDSDSAKEDWLKKYADAGVEQPRRDYCAVMSHADARVGDMLETLRELNLERNTFVIYFSDNGGITHTYPSNNGPFRGGKGTTYEGGLRVPCVMQWPGVIPAGSVSEADAVHLDLFCTILEAAEINIPTTNGNWTLRGESLLPHLISGGQTSLRDRYLFWDLYGKQAALHGDWKIVAELSNHNGNFSESVAEARAHDFELYHLSEDPAETDNVAADYPEIYADLKTRHIQWLSRGER